MTPLFHLENIVRTYPDPASRDPHAVRTVLNLSELDIRAGEILGIRGHNGSGKSTLLRAAMASSPCLSRRTAAPCFSKAGPPGPTICICAVRLPSCSRRRTCSRVP